MVFGFARKNGIESAGKGSDEGGGDFCGINELYFFTTDLFFLVLCATMKKNQKGEYL